MQSSIVEPTICGLVLCKRLQSRWGGGELCELIIDNCPDTHITISSLLTRSDKEGKKVAEVNNKLKLLCSENNFSFLLHSNIDKQCLNKSALHLNKLGDSTLAKNLIETIKHF